jgi:hypothetical protein
MVHYHGHVTVDRLCLVSGGGSFLSNPEECSRGSDLILPKFQAAAPRVVVVAVCASERGGRRVLRGRKDTTRKEASTRQDLAPYTTRGFLLCLVARRRMQATVSSLTL